jgi:uncharacterized RDD family membrane protein YckC
MSTASQVDAPVPAELPARFAARFVDAIVVAAVDAGLGRLIGFGFDWLIIGAVVILAYFVLLDALAGATLGKRALGLRVIGPSGGRPSLRQALIREAFVIVGAIPFVGPLLALAAWVSIVVTIRSSPIRQGKHDRLAGGTQVIRAQRRSSGQTSGRPITS